MPRLEVLVLVLVLALVLIAVQCVAAASQGQPDEGHSGRGGGGKGARGRRPGGGGRGRAAAHAAGTARGRGLLVVPGVGRGDRLLTLISSLKLLEHDYLAGSAATWDCIVYIYAAPEVTEFWNRKNELAYLRSVCKTVENTNKRVAENLHLVQPALIRHTYSHVFVLLDDCKLLSDLDGPSNINNINERAASFNLQRMLSVMEWNNLTIASPRVLGANTGGGQAFRTLMQQPPQPGTEGYAAVFVEWFAWLMTFSAYEAFWELLCPYVQPYGWGYDFWIDGYSRPRVPGHRMGIISSVSVKHEQDVTLPGAGRSETASVETKWAAVQKQEKHYKSHLGVDLKAVRQSLQLKNSSWNGAVTGYLYAPPADWVGGHTTAARGVGGGGAGRKGVTRGSWRSPAQVERS